MKVLLSLLFSDLGSCDGGCEVCCASGPSAQCPNGCAVRCKDSCSNVAGN